MRPILGRRVAVLAAVMLASLCPPASGQSFGQDTKEGLKLGALQVGKILFLGNSITLHGPAPDLGWTGDWGMAASARDRDYVHLLLRRLSKETGGTPKVMIRNIADFERNPAAFDIPKTLKEQLAFQADVVILAIGENVPSLKDDEARKQFADAVRNLLVQIRRNGNPRIFIRGQFWPDAEKDRVLKNAGKDAGAIFVDLGTLGSDPANSAGSERKIEHAGVAGHPGDKGMAAIADALWRAMKDVR